MSSSGQEKKPKKKFSKRQLRASQGILTMQAKTNIYASQSGMTGFGAVRHGSDIKVKELYDEGDDDEYPTDEEDLTPVRPARKMREEVPEQPITKPKPEPKPEREPDIVPETEPEIEVNQPDVEPELEPKPEVETELEQEVETVEDE